MSERVKLKPRGIPFRKGAPRAATAGRRAGTPNKTTRLLREAIILAGEQVGMDKKGKDGLVGYLKFLAKDHPDLFTNLLGRVLPMQVITPSDQTVRVELTLPQMQQRLAERGLPISGVFASPIGTLEPPKIIDGKANGHGNGYDHES